jgi:hypothetical protein
VHQLLQVQSLVVLQQPSSLEEDLANTQQWDVVSMNHSQNFILYLKNEQKKEKRYGILYWKM